jgi:hypothetical protein
LLNHIRKISLFDEYPFEHEIFIRISQLFTIMENLTLTKQTPQSNKVLELTNLSPVHFVNIKELNFDDAHDDYIEQFLMDIKTTLPNNIQLGIE